jgi:hypothetical protein
MLSHHLGVLFSLYLFSLFHQRRGGVLGSNGISWYATKALFCSPLFGLLLARQCAELEPWAGSFAMFVTG